MKHGGKNWLRYMVYGDCYFCGWLHTNHLYRQGVNWANVERSMDAFIGAGGRARWDFLIFEHNQHQVDEAETLAKRKGFEKFMKKKTGRFVDAKTNKKEKAQPKIP